MMLHANVATAAGTPLMLHVDPVVDADVVEVLAVVVETFGVVVGALGVVDGALGVVEGAAGVVDGALGVVVGTARVVVGTGAAGLVVNCLFFREFAHAAVTVICVEAGLPDCVTVDVTSLIGTKEEQKADALSAIKTAAQVPTWSRASS